MESSYFGSEFVALSIATVLMGSLRYKLRSFVVPLDFPSNILCDNKSVVMNVNVPTSMLNKRHNDICSYHV